MFAALLACAASGVAAARDIHVDNIGGDDRNDGRQPASIERGAGPCQSIRRALQLAGPGDRVILQKNDEPYRESVTLEGMKHSGNSAGPFMLIGNGAILDGSAPVDPDAWEFVEGDLFRFQPFRQSFQEIYRAGIPLDRRRLANRHDPLPDLKPLEWCLRDRWVYFRVEPGKLPETYNLREAKLTVGVTLFNVQNVVVSDLIVQGFQLDGINAHNGVLNGRLDGIIARGNARSGVTVAGSSRLKIEASLLGNNGEAQLRCDGWSKTSVDRCNILANTAPAWIVEGGQLTVNGEPAPKESREDLVEEEPKP